MKRTIKLDATSFEWTPIEDEYWRGYVDRMMEDALDLGRFVHPKNVNLLCTNDYELICMYMLATGEGL